MHVKHQLQVVYLRFNNIVTGVPRSVLKQNDAN